MNRADLSSQKYDSLFQKIEGLTWLPWVGRNFDSAPKKLLIVGESHYTGNSDPMVAKEEIAKVSEDPDYTRDVIWECPISGEWANPTFQNLHRALLGTAGLNGGDLWKELSFYNFVQRPMEYRFRERPQWVDFYKGWETFLEVVRILKPDFCLFVGVGASNSFDQAMQELRASYSGVKWGHRISRTYSRGAMVSLGEHNVQLIFMQHSSQMFSWSRWHEYLMSVMGQELIALGRKLGATLELQDKDESFEESCEKSRTTDLPKHLGHKPIIACNYTDVSGDETSDGKYLSIGRAQYNQMCASVKLWRHTGKRWSRQSEEVPIDRLFDMALMLGNTMSMIQNSDSLRPSLLEEEIIDEDGVEFLQGEIEQSSSRILQSAKALRDILNGLNLDAVSTGEV